MIEELLFNETIEINTCIEEIANYLLKYTGFDIYTEEELNKIISLLRTDHKKARKLRVMIYLVLKEGTKRKASEYAQGILNQKGYSNVNFTIYLCKKNVRNLIEEYLNNEINMNVFFQRISTKQIES